MPNASLGKNRVWPYLYEVYHVSVFLMFGLFHLV